jgi:hypothetical protein
VLRQDRQPLQGGFRRFSRRLMQLVQQQLGDHVQAGRGRERSSGHRLPACGTSPRSLALKHSCRARQVLPTRRTGHGDKSLPLPEQRPDLVQLSFSADERGQWISERTGARYIPLADKAILSGILCLAQASIMAREPVP